MINVNVKNYTNWAISSQDSKQKCKNKVQRLSERSTQNFLWKRWGISLFIKKNVVSLQKIYELLNL